MSLYSIPSLIKILRHRCFYALLLRRHKPLVTLGEHPFTWTIDASMLNPGSIVYSAGAGLDISFEKSIVDTTGASVLLLDPTPTGIATLSKPENHRDRITFLPYGLGAANASLRFSPLKDLGGGCYFPSSADSREVVELPCRQLGSIMRERGDKSIDLLKMDIEGFEYDVIRDICSETIKIQQLCVEFHHWLGQSAARKDTLSAIWSLVKNGYRLVHVNGWDHTFIRLRGK